MELDFIRSKKGRIVTWIVFCVYLALLAKVILFKYPINMILTILKSEETLPLSRRIANSNFIPMKTIINFLSGNQSLKISMMNLLGNIIAFSPFGFLLPIVFDRINKLRSVFISSLILSVFFEIIQLLTGIGDFDVDDILLNVFGSICGYLIFRLFIRFFSKK